MNSQTHAGEYALGHSRTEVQRLVAQADLYSPLTARILRDAGLASGMRVLDIGCGAGDVAFLAAEMVGRSGSVIGVDRVAVAVETARQRGQEMGVLNARFICAPLDAFHFAEPFDAVVGRCILLHQPDPVSTVRLASEQVRQGGLMIFHEMNFSPGSHASWPSVPLLERCVWWIHEAAKRCGVQFDMGKRLHQTFRAADLPAPDMRLESLIGTQWRAVGCRLLAQMVNTFLPHIEKHGIATAEEIQIETLASRIERELVIADAIVISSPMIAAWCRKP